MANALKKKPKQTKKLVNDHYDLFVTFVQPGRLEKDYEHATNNCSVIENLWNELDNKSYPWKLHPATYRS